MVSGWTALDNEGNGGGTQSDLLQTAYQIFPSVTSGSFSLMVLSPQIPGTSRQRCLCKAIRPAKCVRHFDRIKLFLKGNNVHQIYPNGNGTSSGDNGLIGILQRFIAAKVNYHLFTNNVTITENTTLAGLTKR